ncbi:alpha/beta hydrolase [Salmonella enterica]|nr:alpha/beta hydrolase [Salmonella enterica]EDB9445781.1 alpha/beta hydrolase [Salmonella enterica subsp. enterica serovar Enteritidis]EBN2823459.1 alpha/beta hydrolase [Salmonella enterica]ECU1628806.1 alpha/beta hydrolase [Salmonella enterica]EDB9460241.1 alpha/beta hydrolase [Salmonella enterica subsp. enterica serovar Enteritidis]
MNPRLLVSGFFLRRSAWSVDIQGDDIDVFRDSAECTLDRWLEEAEKWVAVQNDQVEIIGHSFGGYLAQCLAARLGDQVSHLWLLSALTSEGGCALESYQQSEQSELFKIGKLDLSEGKIRLSDSRQFLSLLDLPVPLAQSEPVQLLLDLPPPEITRVRCPGSYVVTERDKLTPSSVQRHFARILNAKEISCPGGHIFPLHNIQWLRG